MEPEDDPIPDGADDASGAERIDIDEPEVEEPEDGDDTSEDEDIGV